MRRKLISFLLVSLVCIAAMWNIIGRCNDVHFPEIVSQARRLLSEPGFSRNIAIFVALFALSMVARVLRYKLLAFSVGDRISSWTALKAIFVGRAYTLLTPTALFGGQPISYWVMNISGVAWKTSGMLLVMTTMLDFFFFLVLSPLLCFLVYRAGVMPQGGFLSLFASSTLLGWCLFLALVPCMLGKCRWLVRLYGTICRKLPFCSHLDLEYTFSGWLGVTRRSLLGVNKSFPAMAGLAILTALAFIPHYLGLYCVLKGAGMSIGMLDCLLRTLLVNCTTLLFSPGAGSVTGDLGFLALFSQYAPREVLLALDMTFNGLCYWFPIVVGLAFAFALLFHSRKSVAQFHFSRNFMALNSTIEKLVLRNGDGTQECPVGLDNDYAFIVPVNSDNVLSAVIGGREERLYSFKATTECLSLEFGRPEPDCDYGFSWTTLFKAETGRMLARMLVPYCHHRLKARKPLIPRWLGRAFKLSEKAYDENLSNGLNPLLGAWDAWDGKRRQFLKKAIAGYVESRMLRADLLAREKWWLPALMSLQVTDACNLHCRGCQVSCAGACDIDARCRCLMDSLREFHSLGGRHVLLLGGEPLLLGEKLIDLTNGFPDMVFVLFSNATLLTEKIAEKIARSNNVVTVLSVDGSPEETARRRGPRVFEKVLEAQEILNRHHLLNGISVMLHRDNAKMLRDLGFLKAGHGLAHQFVMFVTYTDTYGHDDVHALDLPGQMEFYRDVCAERQKGYPFYFLPQDEMFVHTGCGGMKGIFHIDDEGNLMKCPFSFARIAFRNVAAAGFRKAFQSTSRDWDSGICTANFVTMQKLRENEVAMRADRAGAGGGGEGGP